MPDAAVEYSFQAPGYRIEVSVRRAQETLELVFRLEGDEDCLLHWGLSRRGRGDWERPPEASWPEGTRSFDDDAVRSAFHPETRALRLTLPADQGWASLPFVLFCPASRRWLKGAQGDFRVHLPAESGGDDPRAWLDAQTPQAGWRRQFFTLAEDACLAVGVRDEEKGLHLLLGTDAPAPVVLHWGLVQRDRRSWKQPPQAAWPAGTVETDGAAVRTPFRDADGVRALSLLIPRPIPRGFVCVLNRPDSGLWLKPEGGGDAYVALQALPEGAEPLSESVRRVAERIVEAETGRGSWTLMHRFNLCHDLIEANVGEPGGLALLFVWLRYSAIRQLDWQRNYNTKPRELAHAQDRLTRTVAGFYDSSWDAAPWIRRLLSTLGRGGDGQRVRDEILNIMHRHRIKEVQGHFLEEWHQKLHNNTTPDDIVICEAYLAFLDSSGDLGRFYEVLSAGGVSRERLRGFERPIRTDPDFYADKRDGLVHDFRHFLYILKSVHAGADLEVAAAAARGLLSDQQNAWLQEILDAHGRQAPAEAQGALTVRLRETLAGRITQTQDSRARRELLYLDMALEQTMRSAVEADDLGAMDEQRLLELLRLCCLHMAHSEDLAELHLCARHLGGLSPDGRDARDWALEARSVVERAGRTVADWGDAVYGDLQPLAEYLGESLGVDEWTIPLFSEEVIRGGAGFAVSLVLRHLDPLLRERAGLGGWQVVSPGRAVGRVVSVKSLRSAQGKHYEEPTVLLAQEVHGDEEIPGGVRSVITRDVPDLVSHVAVRARNEHVLFATCFDADEWARLSGMSDHRLSLQVTSAGDLAYEEVADAAESEDPARERRPLSLRRRSAEDWALAPDGFGEEVVGGKALNLVRMRDQIPDWVHTPESIAVPFGVFERVLADPINRGVADLVSGHQDELGEAPVDVVLAALRDSIQRLTPPAAMRGRVEEVWKHSGLPALPWVDAWSGIKRVWASKWTERAYHARANHGIDHDDLMMAVLIQDVVPADYAFVIHTVNPLNGSQDEILAEVVPGLGETLVSNHPGRALGFIVDKKNGRVELLSYPSKSNALRGKGIIFRSDSNGEDLEGYAGAGLYESVLAHAATTELLDYTRLDLVREADFRDRIIRRIAEVGSAMEEAFGDPQDIEGAAIGDRWFVVQTRPQVGL